MALVVIEQHMVDTKRQSLIHFIHFLEKLHAPDKFGLTFENHTNASAAHVDTTKALASVGLRAVKVQHCTETRYCLEK